MTTQYVLRLIQDAATLDLMAAPYTTDFIPPDAQLNGLYAEGTSANRYGGATLIGEHGLNRTITIVVHIRGASDQNIRAALFNLRRFIGRAGDPNHPVYLEYCLNSDISQRPLWGQHNWLHYELVNNDGPAMLWEKFSNVDLRAKGAIVTVRLIVRPLAEGLQQRLARATGSIMPDQWGTPDGAERGLIVPDSTSNKMTNPVFGAPTWNTGWTAGAGITATQNINPNYLLPQTQSSAFLQATGVAALSYTQLITLTVATYQFSALFMRPDGGAVTASDCHVFYNGASLTTTFLNLGDGLYLATGSVTGIASALTTGVSVIAGRSVYLLAIQVEQAGYPTPIRWGDLLGCAWAGTAHASASTGNQGKLSLPIDDTILRAAQGSIALAVVWPRANGAYAALNYRFWDSQDAGGGASGLLAYFNGTTGTLNFGNGTSTATSGAQTINAGEVDIYHFTWGPTSGLTLYKNGVSIATAAYTVQPLGARLVLGSKFDFTVPGLDTTFLDFRAYPHELTQAEVAADYANVSKVTGATVDQAARVGAIPWLWTAGGVDQVQNCDDSTRSNFAVVGGVPGSAPAITVIDGTLSTTFSAFKSIYFSNWQTPFFIDPVNLYSDLNGTGTTIADSGSAATTIVVGTGLTGSSGFSVGSRPAVAMAGREFYCLARVNDAGSNLTIGASIGYDSTTPGALATALTACNSFAAMILVRSLAIISFALGQLHPEKIGSNATVWIALLLQRTTGSANVIVDFFQFAPRPLVRLRGSGGDSFIYSSSPAPVMFNYLSAGPNISNTIASADYDQLELAPAVYNTLLSYLGDDSGAAFDVTRTLTYNKVSVQPRYALL